MQEKLREKAVLISDLHGLKDTEPCAVMVKLLNFSIEETREINDYATGEEFRFNQGKISAYKDLLHIIVSGLLIKRVLNEK